MAFLTHRTSTEKYSLLTPLLNKKKTPRNLSNFPKVSLQKMRNYSGGLNKLYSYLYLFTFDRGARGCKE